MIYQAKLDGKLIATIYYDSNIGKHISDFLMNCLNAGMTLEKCVTPPEAEALEVSDTRPAHRAARKPKNKAGQPQREPAAQTGNEQGQKLGEKVYLNWGGHRSQRAAAPLTIPPDAGRDRALPQRPGHPQNGRRALQCGPRADLAGARRNQPCSGDGGLR